jgi:hypothetical protein
MNTEREQAERMRFLFISEPTTFATYTCGVPLRSLAIILSSVMSAIAIGLAIWSHGSHSFVWFCVLSVAWLSMITGPLTQNYALCYFLTCSAMVATAVEIICYCVFCFDLIVWGQFVNKIGLVIALTHYIVYGFVTTYVYFSYTKSLGLGLLPREEVNQGNSQCMNFIQQTDSICQVAANTLLRVEQSPSIVLTNSGDLAFVSDKQSLTVDNVTLPSGLVVPSGGHGKNWKVIGSSIVLI